MAEFTKEMTIEELNEQIKHLNELKSKKEAEEKERLEEERTARMDELNDIKDSYNKLVDDGLAELKDIRSEYEEEAKKLKKEYEGIMEDRKNSILEETAVIANSYQDKLDEFKKDYKCDNTDKFFYSCKKWLNGKLVENKSTTSKEEYKEFMKESSNKYADSMREFFKLMGD